MGIRCLFGHDFGGREVERDRREDGDEVVVAYRTVETCERCGSRRVVSENKEIKPLESGRDEADREPTRAETGPEQTTPDPDAAPVEQSAASARPETPDPQTEETGDGTAETVTAPADASEDAAIIIDDAPPDPGDAGTESVDGDPDDADPATVDADGASAPDLDAAVASEPETELLGGGADAEAEASPADEGAPADDTAAWPDAATEDDGFDAESPTEGGPTVSTDADGSPAPWPDESGVERDRNGTKFVRPEAETPDRDAETEFHCPNCGATRPSSASSLRSGDVCPECRKGYLAERPVGG
jgi:predicted RNA-binding Zn-ribbon protein involved in translation (DUF1610 family)